MKIECNCFCFQMIYFCFCLTACNFYLIFLLFSVCCVCLLLQQFFGTIRQAGGCNDHPSTPTFLQIYKILSSYSILKPPKTGNCTVNVTNSECLVTLTELKNLYKNNKKPDATLVEKLKQKLQLSISTDDWTIDDDTYPLLEHDYYQPEVFDCLMYYTSEYLCSKLLKTTDCEICKRVLTENTFGNHPITAYASMKLNDCGAQLSRGFYGLIVNIEKLFQKHCNSTFIFEAIITDAIDQGILSFPCPADADEVLSGLILYYVRMRMHRYTQQCNNDRIKENQARKKMSKLCNT